MTTVVVMMIYSKINFMFQTSPENFISTYCKFLIKMDLGEIGRDGRDWIELAQDRDQWRALVNTVMSLRVP
jgi:hypothetical protein